MIELLPDKKILKHFYTFLDVGVYPFYFEDRSRYIDRINDTINKILHIDLSKIYSIQPDKVDTLKKILLIICVSDPLRSV
ncbi:ATPase [hydrothermal vent metagenome]|uniref:ATPase n=1 Tax=hydrothermal vent metagenome TaxID=652676 RepID=A0A1W1BGY2_9ZZZZ